MIDAETLLFVTLAGVLIVGGGLVAAVNSAAPFAHGSWLAAYLVLVGGVAQLVLGVGPLALPGRAGSILLRRTQLLLWNAGAAAVAIGVLADRIAVVLVGSVTVLIALACFVRGGGPIGAGARRRVLGYRAVILALAVSVAVGGVLAAAP